MSEVAAPKMGAAQEITKHHHASLSRHPQRSRFRKRKYVIAKMIPAAGGPARVLCEDTGLGRGGSWNRNGLILLGVDKGLRRVDSRGGPCTAVGREDPGIASGFPAFLPDGKHFFCVRGPLGDQAGVYLAALDDPAGHKVLADLSSVVYTPPAASGGRAHLLFLRENVLMAQPFDDAGLQTVGDPFTVAQQASLSSSAPQVEASASADGTLVYLAGMSRESQLTWFDRTGRELGKVGAPAVHAGVTLSPDGNSLVALRRYQDGSELWLYDLARNSESRLIPRENSPRSGVWSPDSTRIWFEMAGPEGRGLYQKDIRGGQQELIQKEPKASEGAPKSFSDWSRDGRFAIYTENNPQARADIWYVPVESGKPGGKAVKLLGTAANESQGQLSPDGKWLAYYSDETGQDEVYIRPFPMGPGVWKVSVDRAREPRWRSDGRELYFVAAPPNRGAERLMAVALEPDGHGGLRTGAPEKLFDFSGISSVPQSNAWTYSPHPDRQRFLVSVSTATDQPTVNVILNWQRAVAAQTKADQH
jgi:Tol biopolymer transport system component